MHSFAILIAVNFLFLWIAARGNSASDIWRHELHYWFGRTIPLNHIYILLIVICGGKWERRLQILLMGQHTLCNTSYCQSSTMRPQKLRFSADRKRPSCTEECDRPNGDDESEQCATSGFKLKPSAGRQHKVRLKIIWYNAANFAEIRPRDVTA